MPGTTRLDDWVQMIRGEFAEQPHLQLTVAQVAGDWELDRRDAQLILESLVESGLLVRSMDGVYARAETLQGGRARPAVPGGSLGALRH